MKEFSMKKLAEAEKLFISAVEKDSGLLNAHLMLCKIYYYNGNYNSAIDSADAILDKDPDNANALYWKARTLAMSDKNSGPEAINLLTRSVEIDGHNIQARLLLGMMYEKQARYKEALHQYLEVIDKEDDIISARGRLALLYLRMGIKERCDRELDIAQKVAETTGRGNKTIQLIKEEVGKMQ